jgi:hypothetical protein
MSGISHVDDIIYPSIICGLDISVRGTRRSVTETSIMKNAGLNAHRLQDYLATEEPLDIQPGFGPTASRQRKSIFVTMRSRGKTP